MPTIRKSRTYNTVDVTTWPIPNYWDVLAFVLVAAIIFLLALGARGMLVQYQVGKPIPISLNPIELPYYALRTVVRMFLAMLCSLVFTFIFGAWAAKSRYAERMIIPMIDILQSVPVLGFLTVITVVLVSLFPGRLFGAECASIFAIFTAQVWNMTLSFYQSLRTVPINLVEAARVFHLNAWQKFWRIEVPFAMPGLLWNTMLSMSASWVFLVAAEAITVAHKNITLPGIGSYIWLAIKDKDLMAIGYVIIAMVVVIAIYDQLLFRPLVAWAEKFKSEDTASDTVPESWVLNILKRTRLLQFIVASCSRLGEVFMRISIRLARRQGRTDRKPSISLIRQRIYVLVWMVSITVIIGLAAWLLLRFIFTEVPLSEVGHVAYLGLITAVRVTVMIIISSIIWVPIGVWIGLRPKASAIVQPIAQFLAAFPVNLLFPFVAVMIVTHQLNVNIWTSPLMILGTQWYILFNVVAGTVAIPKNLHQAASTLQLQGGLWWRKLILPAIFPYYITGAITAAGGAWNMSIITEAISWGQLHLRATGLGAYITHVADIGDFPRLALGIAMMSLYVILINRFLATLYQLAADRYQIQ